MKIAGYTKSGRGVNTDQPQTDTKRSPKKDKLDRSRSQVRKTAFLSLSLFTFSYSEQKWELYRKVESHRLRGEDGQQKGIC